MFIFSMFGIAPAVVNSFRFHSQLPLASPYAVIALTGAYLFVTAVLKAHVARRGKPYDLTRVAIIANSALAILSAALFLALSDAMIRRIAVSGLWSVVCDADNVHTVGGHILIEYVGLLSKAVEFVDTFSLCLRGKSTPFIHVYHHAITLVFAYIHMHERTCIAWAMALINLAIHVALYSYFVMHELGIRVSWKRYLTMAQVAQFYVTFILAAIVLVPRILFTVDPQWPFAYPCNGSWRATFVGLPLLAIYLILFQNLYNERYSVGIKAAAVKEARSNQAERERQLRRHSMWTLSSSSVRRRQ